MPPLDREALIRLLQHALAALPWVGAAWIGGSEAFGRADAWSDVDLLVITADAGVTDTLDAVEAALATASPIAWRFDMPMPTWHGHAQRIYGLRDAGEFLLVDLVVMQRSHPDRFLEPERHGNPRLLLDREGLVVPAPIDADAWRRRLMGRVATIRAMQPLFRSLVQKAILRGDVIEALQAYHQRLLLPLVELLRIRHDPFRHDFGVRYLRHDLPATVAKRLEALFFIAAPEHLPAKQAEAVAWLDELTAEVAAELGLPGT